MTRWAISFAAAVISVAWLAAVADDTKKNRKTAEKAVSTPPSPQLIEVRTL